MTAANPVLTIETKSAEETRAIGERLGRRLRAGDVVLLFGDLGAGKTTLTQGIAQGLGMTTPVTSPTFTLVQEYRHAETKQHLAHFDPYRLRGEDDLTDLGFEEYLENERIIVVEWAERLGSLTPAEHLRIEITSSPTDSPTEDTRTLKLTAFGERAAALLTMLKLPRETNAS